MVLGRLMLGRLSVLCLLSFALLPTGGMLDQASSAAAALGSLDCRWLVSDHANPGHLLGRLPPAIRARLSDATVALYPGHGGGFVAHPTDLLAIRPYDIILGAAAKRETGECTARNGTDTDEGYFHSLAADAVSDCCAACAKNDSCTFATWAKEAAEGKCWLKNATSLTPHTAAGTTLLTINGRPAPPPPPVLYWRDAWDRNLIAGPAAMAALALNELNGARSSLLMIDYEPPYSPCWNFSTQFSSRPEPLWEAKLAAIHRQSFDSNWTELVGWSAPSGAHCWKNLSAADKLSLQETSWNWFCQRYLTAGIRAIKAALPAGVGLSFWNFPSKFWFHQGVIGKEQWFPLMDELGWLWAELPVFMPDLYQEFFSGDTKPTSLQRCVTENATATRAYFQDNVNEALRLRDKYNPTAKVFLSVWWHYMCAQEVGVNETAPPFVKDGNLDALFAATGHDGIAIWGSVGDAKGEDQSEPQVAAYFEQFWGALVSSHCMASQSREIVTPGRDLKTDDDDDASGGHAAKRLFVQYGYYLNGTNATRFSNHTLELLTPGSENVMVVSSGVLTDRRASQWAEAGGVFAW